MRRELSTRTFALIAICLAVGSSLFCWGFSRRSAFLLERRERAIIEFESRLDELRNEMVNVGALLMKSGEMPSRSGRIAPANSLSARFCDLGSSPTLFLTYETARANEFLAWYYLQMKQLHRLEQERLSVPSRGPGISARDASHRTNAAAVENERGNRDLNSREGVSDREQNQQGKDLHRHGHLAAAPLDFANSDCALSLDFFPHR